MTNVKLRITTKTGVIKTGSTDSDGFVDFKLPLQNVKLEVFVPGFDSIEEDFALQNHTNLVLLNPTVRHFSIFLKPFLKIYEFRVLII